jgi:hypothetical protein
MALKGSGAAAGLLEVPLAVILCRFAALAGEARMAEPEATAVIGVWTIGEVVADCRKLYFRHWANGSGRLEWCPSPAVGVGELDPSVPLVIPPHHTKGRG